MLYRSVCYLHVMHSSALEIRVIFLCEAKECFIDPCVIFMRCIAVL